MKILNNYANKSVLQWFFYPKKEKKKKNNDLNFIFALTPYIES